MSGVEVSELKGSSQLQEQRLSGGRRHMRQEVKRDSELKIDQAGL